MARCSTRMTSVSVGLQAIQLRERGNVDLVTGTNYSCALNDLGQVTCWGTSTTGVLAPPASALGLVELTGGSTQACAVDSGVGLKCWGGNSWSQTNVFQ